MSRATRLARYTVPRCWVPHNPYLSIYQAQYESAQLDMCANPNPNPNPNPSPDPNPNANPVLTLTRCRLVFAYQWSRATFGVTNLNKNSYNKDLRSAVWLAVRCDALLRKRAP